MTRCFGIVSAVFLMVMGSGPVQASNCAVDNYDHNGSVMEVQMCDSELFISYSTPKSSLRKIGIVAGTTLFEGKVSKIGSVSGTARRFSASCGEISYAVEGAIRPNSILLEGQAPSRNSKCKVTEYRFEELLFTLESFADKVEAKDWYAVAGSFRDRSSADQRARSLARKWRVMNSRDCPNFTTGYWLVAAGPMSEQQADTASTEARKYQAYAKNCN